MLSCNQFFLAGKMINLLRISRAMEYSIDLSFPIRQCSVGETTQRINELAERYNCISCRSEFEIGGRGHTVTRNHKVITVVFKSDDLYGMVLFIREIKRIRGVYIESIIKDDSVFYASKYYLTLMSKDKATEYSRRKTGAYDDEDSILLREVRN